jgi:hypothetical protein
MSVVFINESTIPGTVASLIAAVIFGIVIFLIRKPLIKLLQKLFPQFESRTPHVNFETQSKQVKGSWKTDITISNAGDEPAYNVYVFMAEHFPMGDFKIQSLGDQNVRRAVLGIRDSIIFKDLDVLFDGCNITCDQQMWIEFENSAGINFRTVVLPITGRGDSERAIPSRVIKRRLERLPGLTMEGDDKEWKKLEKGKISHFKRVRRIELLLWRIKNIAIKRKLRKKNPDVL